MPTNHNITVNIPLMYGMYQPAGLTEKILRLFPSGYYPEIRMFDKPRPVHNHPSRLMLGSSDYYEATYSTYIGGETKMVIRGNFYLCGNNNRTNSGHVLFYSSDETGTLTGYYPYSMDELKLLTRKENSDG